jgi:hypothetical protein
MKKIMLLSVLLTMLCAFQAQASVYDQDLFNQLPGEWKFTTSDGRSGKLVFPANLLNGSSAVPGTILLGGGGTNFTWGFRTISYNRNWMDCQLSTPLQGLPKVSRFLVIFKKDSSGKWIFSGNFYDSNVTITYGSKK